jgi:N-acetylgalactosamine-6-sulfatase
VPAARIDDTSVLAGVDFMPTVCRLAGVPMPAGHDFDGEDVSDILFGQSRPRTKPLLWEWRFNIAGHVWNRSPQLAIRDGNWTLMMNPDRSRTELYDLTRDRLQTENLAATYPDVVARLAEPLLGWHAQLPDGPRDAAAGRNDYPWPGEAATKAAPAGAGARQKGKKSRPATQ